MITKDQAATLTYRSEVYSLTSTDSKGFPHRARVNGAMKTWKRDATRWELPVKFGLYDCLTLAPWNADQWTIDREEAETAAAVRKERSASVQAAREAFRIANPGKCPQGCERGHLHE